MNDRPYPQSLHRDTVAQILQLPEVGALVEGAIGRVEGEVQAAVQATEDHTVTAVAGIQRRQMLEIATQLAIS